MCTGDYVVDPYHRQNVIKIRLPLFAPQIRENAPRVTRLVFWFFLQPTAKTPGPIFTINTSNDVVSRKDVPFGGPENKILHFDPIFPK